MAGAAAETAGAAAVAAAADLRLAGLSDRDKLRADDV